MINEQKELEIKCGALYVKRSTLTGLANRGKYMETQTEITNLSSLLQENQQKLFRALADNPNIDDNSKRLIQEKLLLEELLYNTYQDVQQLHFTTLRDFVEKELENKNRLSNLRDQRKELLNSVNSLESQIQKENSQFTRSMKEHGDNIEILKIKLRVKIIITKGFIYKIQK